MTDVGVYNRYWTTGGGAETYGAALAQVLARSRTVELLGPDEVDIDELAEHLRLDLTGVTFRPIGQLSSAVTTASADYDLFVNVSYLSRSVSRGARSMYIVHFPGDPDADLSPAQRLAIWTLGPLMRSHALVREWGRGFYPPEGGRPRAFWTNGDARYTIETRRDAPLDVRLVFAWQRPEHMDPVDIVVEVDGQKAAELTLTGGGSLIERRFGVPVVVTVPPRPAGGEAEIRIISDTFVPTEAGTGDDDRPLGVALTSLHTGTRRRDRIAAQLGSWFPLLYRRPEDQDWLDSYDHLVCNSAFTQGWIRRWWDREAEVLHPPVRMHDGGEKEPIILSVGRFFGTRSGHSKKQLELVQAFRRLLDRGVEGWTLHLVGGCDDEHQDYLAAVRTAAEGLPVELHVDASGEELTDLYARASIFWHATGLGEDPEAEPHRLEHFGISTVEAMSAGAVPVVIGVGGQVEIVEDGVNGLLFSDLEGLVDETVALIDDGDRRRTLARAAAERAQDFSLDRFAERLEALLAD